MNRNVLDEMQLKKRDKIGNQSFMLLFYLLMLDIGLYGFGIKWLQYPINVFVIMLACMSYYLIRIIWSNAYIGPGAKNRAADKKVIYIAAAAGLTSAAAILIFHRGRAANAGDNGAVLLFIASVVCIFVTILVAIIAGGQNRKSDE